MTFTHRILLILATAFVLLTFLPVQAQEPAAPATTLYLPLVDSAIPPGVFGFETARFDAGRSIETAVGTGASWLRRNALLWYDVEPTEGAAYKWDAPRTRLLEEDLRNAAKTNLNVILIVRGSPPWAVAPYEAGCAPINPAKVDAFARFMAAAVERYSKPPFNVKYWEIGNEPDAYIFPNDAPFGCWGIESDPYYGGEAYGRMLMKAAAAMRQANPQIKILNGGLLLFRPYDPADPTTRSGRFFEGILRAGAGASFDIVSFHSYTYYLPTTSQPLGPQTDWRVNYLRDLLRRYNVPEKPLMRTESALLCVEATPDCRWAQADYVGRLFARSMRDGLMANIWYKYDRDSFHNTALIDPDDPRMPRITYFAYRQAAEMLSGATYIGPVANVPAGVEIYRFRRGSELVDVYWTDNRQGVAFTLSVSAQARVKCFDRDGGPLACPLQNGRLVMEAEQSPRYVVISP
jgi:hypothetical protein